MLNCYKCGGELKRMRSKIVYGQMARNDYVCKMCGTRSSRKEAVDQKTLKRIEEYKKTAALQKEMREYCQGDNCLTCKFTKCKHDVTDGTSASRKAFSYA